MTEGRPGRDETRSEQAIAWLVRMTSGEPRGEDWRALEAWLAADPANLDAYAEVEALWAEIDERAPALKARLAAAGTPPANVVAFTPRARKPRRAGPPAWAATAAAAALVLVAGGAGLASYLRTRPVTYQTAPGRTQQIALADGTQVELNGGSKIAVGFDAHSRRVKMDAGAEAAFNVTKDPRRPFLIAAGDDRIRVVGTAFDVDHQGDRLVVTVRRGVVEVGRAGPGGTMDQVVRVPAGYQLTRDGDPSASRLAAVDPDEAFAWRQGRLICRDEPLSQIASALNHAFPTPVETSGAAGSLRFSGVLVLDNEDAVVRRLQAFLPVEADRSENRIVLVSRP